MMPNFWPIEYTEYIASWDFFSLLSTPHLWTLWYRVQEKLGFHYEFQQAPERKSRSLGSVYLLFLMLSVKNSEEQHMTLGG